MSTESIDSAADNQLISVIRKPPKAYLAAAFLFAAVCLILAIRGTDLHQAWRRIAVAEPGPLLLAAGLFSSASFVRALRWRRLLSARAHTSVGLVFWATAAGLAGNNFLPLRAGELVRTAIINISAGVSKTFTVATVIVERIADTLVLLALMPVVLPYTVELPAAFHQKLNWFTGALFMVAIILPWSLRGADNLRRLLQRIVPFSLHRHLDRVAVNFGQGLGSVFHARRGSIVVAFSVLAWALDAAAAIVIAGGMDLHLRYLQAFTFLALLGLASALPSTPGYVGLYQFVAVTVLAPFGFGRSDALAYIMVFQAVSYVQVLFWTALGAGVYRNVFVNWRRATRACAV